MRTKIIGSLSSNIWVAVTAFIFPALMLLSACDRVPEPTASTNANTEDPNLQDAMGSESGVTSEPSDTAEAVDDKFRPPSSEARPKASPSHPANPAKVE